MGWKAITVGIAATFAVLFAFMGRYEMFQPSGDAPAVAFRLDRWTGEVLLINGAATYQVRTDQPITH